MPHTKHSGKQQSPSKPRPAADLLYEPLDFVLVRAPLLPFETYRALSRPVLSDAPDAGHDGHVAVEPGTLLPTDPNIRRALAVGSSELLNALERASPTSRDAAYVQGKLLRYLIRMSTRPTPYGLFAGVALAHWGPHTDLALAGTPPRTRTRPDMDWLLRFVLLQEARPAVRHHLRFVANTAAYIHADRVLLAERAPMGEAGAPQAVSLRATGVVRRALALARTPITYQAFVDHLIATTPGATLAKVEQLITDLWQQTLLLTDLRPPLTTNNPARYVAERLSRIPAAHDASAQLQAILDAATAWDALPPEEGAGAYRQLVARAKTVTPEVTDPLQVDMGLALAGHSITRAVGAEVARAAELLLKLTPLPRGLGHITAYRRAFTNRYGHHREVPLLEVLDPNIGLGPPATYTNAADQIDPAHNARRQHVLRDLAFAALRDRRLIVELDNDTVARLETWSPTPATAPTSLDLNVFVAAVSAEAVDQGHFQIIIGPNLGASAAGRNLGRFADLLEPAAETALHSAARAEEAHAPDQVWAELVYLPRRFRSANVTIRPAVRRYEIGLALSAGVSSERTIPLDELVVGVRQGRFYVRWLAENKEIVVCAGHMLNTLQAPPVARLLSDISKDNRAQLSTFDWGSAANFPVLPRVQAGRSVLRPAQWRIDTFTRATDLPPDSSAVFRQALQRWRAQWQTPQHVYLSVGDNRLLLDLDDDAQVEELRAELRHLRDGAQIVLQEALPAPDQVWLRGSGGHFVTEFVVSLIQRPKIKPPRQRVESVPASMAGAAAPRPVTANVPPTIRLRPPGSEWLFAKIYCSRAVEDDVIAGPLRAFAANALAAGLAEAWFFIRYSDPDPHLRLRFRGTPEQLTRRLLPELCAWASELINDEVCFRFSFDTYDREIERYGGTAGTEVAETLFAIDSRAAAELLAIIQRQQLAVDRTTLAVLSIDNLLAGLQLTEADRLAWYREQVFDRNESGTDYRQRKVMLRSLLSDPLSALPDVDGEKLVHVLAAQRTALAAVADRFDGLHDQLDQPLAVLYRSFVHLHCNRLLGTNAAQERRVLGLLLRTREGLERSAHPNRT